MMPIRVTAGTARCSPTKAVKPVQGGTRFAAKRRRHANAQSCVDGSAARRMQQSMMPRGARRAPQGASLFSLMDDINMALDPFSAFAMQLSTPESKVMALDVFETDEHVEVWADIPGVSKDAIKIESNKDVMTISVSQETPKESTSGVEGVDGEAEDKTESKKWYRSERSRTFMPRSLRLPEYANAGAASASYIDGVLQVRIPIEKRKPEGVQISVS